jgi:predicted RNase H-like HicB family nuclease
MNIEYTVQIWREGPQYVAHAMPLDVMSSGASPEEARRALYEAIGLYLQTAAEMNSLDEILEESGYTLDHGEWVSPDWIAVERHSTLIEA